MKMQKALAALLTLALTLTAAGCAQKSAPPAEPEKG